jgi:hypothetical protein
MQEEDLFSDELDRSEHDVLTGALHVLEVLESRETVSDLPDQVGKKQESRDRAADPDPSPAELAAFGREKKSDRHGAAEEQHRMFVLEAEPREETERDPVPRVAGAHDPDERPDAAHPEERFERIHRHQAVDGEEDGREQGAEAGERLREPAASELTSEDHRDRDLRGTGESGDGPQHGKGSAEQQRGLRVEGDEGSAVDVAPVKMAAEIEEVELVAEVAVAVGRREMQCELRGDGDEQQDHVERGDVPGTRRGTRGFFASAHDRDERVII